MLKFIKFLQLLILGIVGAFVIQSTVLHGIGIFNERYVIMSLVLATLLELAVFIIYKLVEDDFTNEPKVK
ncbi:MAG: hypothetical protein GY920_17985 [Aliivibrio sp.]|nr:hypothetical protein [Aliivibrio sp.]